MYPISLNTIYTRHEATSRQISFPFCWGQVQAGSAKENVMRLSFGPTTNKGYQQQFKQHSNNSNNNKPNDVQWTMKNWQRKTNNNNEKKNSEKNKMMMLAAQLKMFLHTHSSVYFLIFLHLT